MPGTLRSDFFREEYALDYRLSKIAQEQVPLGLPKKTFSCLFPQTLAHKYLLRPLFVVVELYILARFGQPPWRSGPCFVCRAPVSCSHPPYSPSVAFPLPLELRAR